MELDVPGGGPQDPISQFSLQLEGTGARIRPLFSPSGEDLDTSFSGVPPVCSKHIVWVPA